MDIAAALDIERLREVMTELLERSAAVARRDGGTVEYTGDGVMALFGTPIALKDQAFRACVAAPAIQEDTNRLAVEVALLDRLGRGVERWARTGENGIGTTVGEDRTRAHDDVASRAAAQIAAELSVSLVEHGLASQLVELRLGPLARHRGVKERSRQISADWLRADQLISVQQICQGRREGAPERLHLDPQLTDVADTSTDAVVAGTFTVVTVQYLSCLQAIQMGKCRPVRPVLRRPGGRHSPRSSRSLADGQAPTAVLRLAVAPRPRPCAHSRASSARDSRRPRSCGVGVLSVLFCQVGGERNPIKHPGSAYAARCALTGQRASDPLALASAQLSGRSRIGSADPITFACIRFSQIDPLGDVAVSSGRRLKIKRLQRNPAKRFKPDTCRCWPPRRAIAMPRLSG
jgi:hypothetical protein